MQLLTERHSDQIDGVLSCYDRVYRQGELLLKWQRPGSGSGVSAIRAESIAVTSGQVYIRTLNWSRVA